MNSDWPTRPDTIRRIVITEDIEVERESPMAFWLLLIVIVGLVYFIGRWGLDDYTVKQGSKVEYQTDDPYARA